MVYFRRSGGQLALLVLSVIGMIIALYLTFVHYDSAQVPLVCSTSGLIDCSRVLASPFSIVPGTNIPISIPGFLWCLVGAALAFAGLRAPSKQADLLKKLIFVEVGWTSLGMLSVFYLVYAEIVRLHTICIWCTALHIIIFLMLILSVLLLQSSSENEEEFDLEEAETSIVSVSRKK